MPYLKAEAVLPPELLLALQEYVQGSLVYVPRPASGRLGWGRKNGARLALDERNEAIRRAKAQGASIDELADLYGLSTDGIRKVLYGPKKSPVRTGSEASQAKAVGA
jgi:Mor family transcriptional regulator